MALRGPQMNDMPTITEGAASLDYTPISKKVVAAESNNTRRQITSV
jgi:hypothetical protein